MTKIRLKKGNIGIAIGVVVVLVVLVAGLFRWKQTIDYQKTYEYQLQKHGYSEEDTAYLLEHLNDEQLENILDRDVDENIPKFMKETYYLEKNLDAYLTYFHEHEGETIEGLDRTLTLTDVVAIVNVHADKEWYTDYTNADISKDTSLLANKFHYLGEEYEPDDLVEVSNWYAYGDKPMLRKVAYDEFIGLYNAAKEDGQDVIINSSYRDYQYQYDLYNRYISWYGQKKTDEMAARPGFSEHQTGLTVDVTTYGANENTFQDTEEFAWLQNHAHEYGFILRYPEGKEYLTGYEYESWHYRYVGVDIATYIYEHDITFDEYYAFFLEGE